MFSPGCPAPWIKNSFRLLLQALISFYCSLVPDHFGSGEVHRSHLDETWGHLCRCDVSDNGVGVAVSTAALVLELHKGSYRAWEKIKE